MYKKLSLTAALVAPLALVTLAASALAADKVGVEAIVAQLPGVDPADVVPAPIDGLYEIALGPQIAYISGDARYLLKGEIIDLTTNVNLTNERRNLARASLVKEVSEQEVIAFGPKDAKYTITVFTDIDCGYCRKLHQEMGELNDLGVRVQYMFFPRSGPGTASWKKAENVWCSADRNDALTRAKGGENVVAASCATPIAVQYDLGKQVGLRGTPAILMENGELIAGYLPAAQLIKRLDSAAASSTANATAKAN